MGLLSQSAQSKGLLAKPETKPVGVLSGATTISKAPMSTLDKVLSKLPNNMAGGILRGLIEGPKKIVFGDEQLRAQQDAMARQGYKIPIEDKIASGGLLSTVGMSKDERINKKAEALISKGTDTERAYRLSMLEQNSKPVNPLDIEKARARQTSEDAYAKEELTPVEKRTIRNENLKHGLFSALDVISIPFGGTVEKRVGKQSIEELKNSGLLKKATDPMDSYNKKTNSFIESYSRGEEEIKRLESLQSTIDAQENPLKFNEIQKQIDAFEPEVVGFMRAKADAKREAALSKNRRAIASETPTVKAKKAPLLAKPVKKVVSEEEYGNLQRDLDVANAYYDNNIDTYNDLVKYQEGGANNKMSTGLPEVLGKEGSRMDGGKYARNAKALTFQKKGDDILSELGFEDRDVANEFLQTFKNAIEQRKMAKEALRTSSVLKKPVQKTVLVPKEEVSVATKAEDRLLQVPREYQSKVRSLPSIIERTVTDVKRKVHFLDYMRTPDRVLKKIGFEKEAAQVRSAYEDYVRELPKNIDKISAWSKEVPKESNEKIFKYLDGQEMALSAKEMKVAGEIQAWMKEWARRLDLPEDKQISRYITHIFDDSIVAKEFDEDLAKIISDKIPGQVYDPFLLKRLGAKGYKQDTWGALDAYVKRATRKAHMDPVLEKIQTKAGVQLEFSPLEESQFKYIQRYVKNVNMRPTELDNLIDNGLKSVFGYKYGTRPVTYITKLFRQLTFRGMLGGNAGSALRNLSQGINTYAVLGEKYTVLGYAKLFNPANREELKASGIFNDSFIQDRTLSSTKKLLEKVDKGLFAMFQTAEHINRGSAYLGAKAKGIAKGMTEEKAIEYAKKVVRDTQFNFGSVDTPVALQNDIMKTLFQFQTYTVKQIEFLTEMAKDKNFMGLLRYTVAGLAFTYTIGKLFGMKPEQLIPTFRFDTPPSLKVPVEIGKAALNSPDKYGQPRDLKQKASDIGKAFTGIIPGGSQAKKTYEGAKMIREGGSFDKGGNLQYEAPQTKGGKVQALLFGKYNNEKAQKYFDRSKDAEEDMKKIQPTYDKAQKLLAEGKKEEAQALVDNLGEKGYEVYKKIKAQDKAEKTKQGKKDILPTFQKARKLLAEGKIEEAQTIVDGLTDEQYKYYELLKNQLD